MKEGRETEGHLTNPR